MSPHSDCQARQPYCLTSSPEKCRPKYTLTAPLMSYIMVHTSCLVPVVLANLHILCDIDMHLLARSESLLEDRDQ